MQRLSKYIVPGLVVIILIAIVLYFQTRTFQGKVIDADTKEPIEGAVVVAEWNTERNTPTATHTDLKDVKECLTDKNGQWSIRGPRGWANEPIPYSSLFIPYTKEPVFTIFKPGYCPWPSGFGIEACRGRLTFTGDKQKGIGEGGVLELPELTKREDRLRAQGIGSSFLTATLADKQKATKIKNFLRLLNEEKKRLGLDQYPIWKELENEK